MTPHWGPFTRLQHGVTLHATGQATHLNGLCVGCATFHQHGSIQYLFTHLRIFTHNFTIAHFAACSSVCKTAVLPWHLWVANEWQCKHEMRFFCVHFVNMHKIVLFCVHSQPIPVQEIRGRSWYYRNICIYIYIFLFPWGRIHMGELGGEVVGHLPTVHPKANMDLGSYTCGDHNALLHSHSLCHPQLYWPLKSDPTTGHFSEGGKTYCRCE